MLSSTNITKIAIAFRIYCQVTIWLFVIELLSWEYYYHRHKSTIEYDKETSSSSSSILSCPSAVMIDSCLVLSSIVFFFSLVSSIVFVTVIVLSLTLINSQKDNKSLWFLFFSCPGQLNRWHCHSVSQWVSESDFWFHQLQTLVDSRH